MRLEDICVLHVTNNLGYGGVQKIIYQLCSGTKQQLKRVEVASSGGEYVGRLSEIGINHFEIPDLSTKKASDIIKIIQILSSIVKRDQINIIHCHHRMAVLYAKLIRFKGKIIYNNHTIYSDKARLTHNLLKHVNVIADGIQAKRNVCDFFGVAETQVHMIYNAVDAYDGYFSEIEEISNKKRQGNFIVMNSARLHPQKGMEYFVDAAEILVRKKYNISFFIVGDGPLKKEIVERVRGKGLQDHIQFLGFRRDIKNTIRQSDVLVMTSIYEGLPLTPMEAFSVKKAVIGTDIDGTREVIEDNYNGLLAETKNPVSIAEKIEQVYLDRGLLEQFEIHAYKTYMEKFSIQPFTDAYSKYYKSL